MRRSPYWWACFTLPNGKRRQVSTKIRDDGKAASRRQAQAVADAYEGELATAKQSKQFQRVAARLHRELHRQAMPTTSAAAFVTDWADRQRGQVSESTLTNYRGKARLFAEWLDDDERGIATITEGEVLAFREHEAEQVAPRTVNGTIKVLRMAFESARKRGLITDNPFADLKPLKTTTAKRRPFTPSELTAVIEAATPEWASMIRFGYYLGGQRLKDVALLRWSAIDAVQGVVRLTTSKTGHRIACPITGPFLEHLANLEPPPADQPDAYVHPHAAQIVNRTKDKNTGHLSRQFGDLLASVGLIEKRDHHKVSGAGRRHQRQELSFHSLRDTVTTQLKASGVQSPLVQEIVGHKSAEMSDIYTKFPAAVIQEAVEALPPV